LTVEVHDDYVPGLVPWRLHRLQLREHPYPGRFISFDGIDGSGKSSLIRQLSAYLDQQGQAHLVMKTPSEDVRQSWVWKAFFDADHLGERPEVDTYGMSIMSFGDRIVHQRRVVEPALRAGTWVLCDRYIMSSAVFQADLVHQLLARTLIRPDLGVVVDVEPGEALRRIGERGTEKPHPHDPGRHLTARERLRVLAGHNDFMLIETTSAAVHESFEMLRDGVDALLDSAHA
jgi:dTMP kinase